MHEKQFGMIANLPVVDGEPVLNKAKVTRRRSLNRPSVKPPTSKNFRLKASHLKLLESLDEIGCGMVERVTFREGLPCEFDDCAI